MLLSMRACGGRSCLMTIKATNRFVQFAKGHRPVVALTMAICQKTFKIGSRLVRGITVEPIFFLYNLNFATYYIIFQNLQIEKACRVNLNQTEIICANLKDPANQNVQVTAQNSQNTTEIMKYNR